MSEFIYIAESPQYPGVVKIGRTSRDVQTRMNELSDGDYGLPGYDLDSEWEAVKIIEVEDSIQAEAMLHDHYSSIRLTDRRELFETDDPVGIAYEAETLVDGTIMTTDLIELGNLFDPISIVAIGAAITLAARTFAPENKNTKKAENFMRDWELRTQKRYKNAKTDTGKFIFGGMNILFRVNKTIGEAATTFTSGLFNGLGLKNNKHKTFDNKIRQLPLKEFVMCEHGHQAVKRTNKLNGQEFWGCSMFPECRWTKKK